ncbi:hypothetical protein D3C73_1528010 [compost metagenome]
MINQRPYDLQPGDDPEYPVEPAALLHGIQMRADHYWRAVFYTGKRGIHGAHVVGGYCHPKLLTTGTEVIADPYILFRQR